MAWTVYDVLSSGKILGFHYPPWAHVPIAKKAPTSAKNNAGSVPDGAP